jgi:hypothetical protein
MIEIDPSGNIYITSKAAMVAEARLRHMDLASQGLVAWYSVCIIALSLIDLSQSYRVRDVSVMTAILSIAVLATSIFLSGQGFGVRAARFRECYLKLQHIYRLPDSSEAKAIAYDDTLTLYENHLQCDYERVLFQAWLHDKSLADCKGAVVATRAIITKTFFRIALGWVLFVALISAPILVGYLLTIPREVV